MRNWQGCWWAGLCSFVLLSPTMGQGWEPVYPKGSSSAGPITLGKPVRYTRPISVGTVPGVTHQTSYRSTDSDSNSYYQPYVPSNPYPPNNPGPYAPYSGNPGPANPFPPPNPYPNNPYPPGGGGMGNPYVPQGGGYSGEEAFNCGVINDGAMSGGGGGTSGGKSGLRQFWDRLFDPGPRSNEGGGGGSGGGFPFFRNSAPVGGFTSDPDFPKHISPVSNPVYFEDPMAITEFRPLFFYQKAPGDNPLMRGGNIYNFNFQGRIAWNREISLIIHRLGFAIVDPGDMAFMGFGGGTALTDIQLGPKWTFLHNDRSGSLGAVGANFEIPLGSTKSLSGSGSGVTPYVSFAQNWDNFNFMAAGGYRFGFSKKGNDFFFVSGHIDYNFFEKFFPLIEANWYHVTKNGNKYPLDFGGGDFNLGSSMAAGSDVFTLAGGLRYKFNNFIQMGAVYEMPIVGQSSIQKYRIGIDFIFRY